MTSKELSEPFRGKEPWRMAPEDIAELLRCRGWNRTDLAAALHVTENTVFQWFSARRRPSGPACLLMRRWLEDARKGQTGRTGCTGETG